MIRSAALLAFALLTLSCTQKNVRNNQIEAMTKKVERTARMVYSLEKNGSTHYRANGWHGRPYHILVIKEGDRTAVVAQDIREPSWAVLVLKTPSFYRKRVLGLPEDAAPLLQKLNEEILRT